MAIDAHAMRVNDLRLQSRWVTEEIDRCLADAVADIAGLGIHKTQIEALRTLIVELTARIDEPLDRLAAATEPGARAAALREVTVAMIGRAEAWQVFRSALALRRDPSLRPALDVVDLVAARAYEHLQDRARTWGRLPGYRPPPLAVLRAMPGAATATKGKPLSALADAGFALRRYRDQPLPVAVVLVSAEQCGCVWRFVSVFHEVGHVFDADVLLSAELAVHSALPGRVDPSIGPRVRGWAAEIAADVIGLALGGDAFLSAMVAEQLTLLGPDDALDEADRHPPPWVRVPLLFELARELKLEARTATDELRATFDGLPKPPWLAAIVEHLPEVAALFVTTRLAALGQHALLELAPSRPDRADGIGQLTDYLAAAGQVGRLVMRGTQWGIDYDAVPIAAERARLINPAWSTVHAEAMAYAAQQLDRPPHLAAPDAADPVVHWQALARAFTPLVEEEAG